MILNIEALFPNHRRVQSQDAKKSNVDSIKEAKTKVQQIIENGKNRRK